MKKTAAVLLFVVALSGTAFAEGFVKSEADRSGATGTLAMVNNSIHGFFESLGRIASSHKTSSAETPKTQ